MPAGRSHGNCDRQAAPVGMSRPHFVHCMVPSAFAYHITEVSHLAPFPPSLRAVNPNPARPSIGIVSPAAVHVIVNSPGHNAPEPRLAGIAGRSTRSCVPLLPMASTVWVVWVPALTLRAHTNGLGTGHAAARKACFPCFHCVALLWSRLGADGRVQATRQAFPLITFDGLMGRTRQPRRIGLSLSCTCLTGVVAAEQSISAAG